MPLEATDGGRKPRATDDDILDVFRETSDPVLSTAEVAEALPIQRRGTLNRLRRLQEDGRLDSKQIGGRNTVWWLADRTASTAPSESPPPTDGEAPRSPESGVTGGESERSETEGVTTPDTSDADESGDTRGERDLRAVARDRIGELDLAGSGAKYDRRCEAVLQMYDHLRANPGEWFQRSDFQDLLDGVDVGYAGFASLWSNWVKGSGERPNILETLPGVELSGDEYQYRPTDE